MHDDINHEILCTIYYGSTYSIGPAALLRLARVAAYSIVHAVGFPIQLYLVELVGFIEHQQRGPMPRVPIQQAGFVWLLFIF